MNLELKQLAPYFQHDLRIMIGEYETGIMGLTHHELRVGLQRFPYSQNVLYSDIKPILHPLSALMKEIVYKEEKFVPIEEISDHFPHLQPYDDDHSPQLFYEWIEGKIEYANGMDRGDIPYSIMQKLFEWHIDVFGLIDKGLAIPKP